MVMMFSSMRSLLLNICWKRVSGPVLIPSTRKHKTWVVAKSVARLELREEGKETPSRHRDTEKPDKDMGDIAGTGLQTPCNKI